MGKTIPGANVKFKLYNYAELFPLATKITDEEGKCSISLGLGDIFIVAERNGAYGYQKVSVKNHNAVQIILRRVMPVNTKELYTFIPPEKADADSNPISEKLEEANKKRLVEEDKIRARYVSTFIDSVAALKIAKETKLNAELVWHYLKMSKGNWPEIKKYFLGISKAEKKWALQFLAALSEKDKRDTPSEILIDHLRNSVNTLDNIPDDAKKHFTDYILSARIDNEILSSYKGFFLKNFDTGFIKKAKGNPVSIADWIYKNIRVNDRANLYDVPITPVGVYELGRADKHSRDIFFVAICRSIGIPARFESTEKKLQYYHNGSWKDVYYGESVISKKRSYLKLNNANPKSKIEYYHHFTLAKFKNGDFNTLEFDYYQAFDELPELIELDPGSYYLLTGNRLGNGKILSDITYFMVGKGQTKNLEIKIREEKIQQKNSFEIKFSSLITEIKTGKKSYLAELYMNKAAVLIWIDPGKEPTKHVFQELIDRKDEVEKCGLQFALITSDDYALNDFKLENYKNLPSNTNFYIDNEKANLNFKKQMKGGDTVEFPMVVVMNDKHEIIYFSEGYKIGIVDDILKLF